LRIISLNTWGGRALHPLMEFFRRHGPSTDIFCLQEMHDTTAAYRQRQHPDEHVCPDLLGKMATVLPEHIGFFADWEDNPDRMSIAFFVRADIPLEAVNEQVVYVPQEPKEHGSAVISPRKLQYLTVLSHDADKPVLTVVHYHGLWEGNSKDDTPERIEQSRTLYRFLEPILSPVILCGDFNVHPGTESYRILRERFDKELVVDRGWPGTRTPLYRHFREKGFIPYADYCFVTGDVAVEDFRVMGDLASDHAALLLDVAHH